MIGLARFIEFQPTYSLTLPVTAVAQFAVSCGLDKLSSPCTAEAPPSILDRPRDLIELGERISTFWNIFVADRFIALSSGFATTIDVDVGCLIFARLVWSLI